MNGYYIMSKRTSTYISLTKSFAFATPRGVPVNVNVLSVFPSRLDTSIFAPDALQMSFKVVPKRPITHPTKLSGIIIERCCIAPKHTETDKLDYNLMRWKSVYFSIILFHSLTHFVGLLVFKRNIINCLTMTKLKRVNSRVQYIHKVTQVHEKVIKKLRLETHLCDVNH